MLSRSSSRLFLSLNFAYLLYFIVTVSCLSVIPTSVLQMLSKLNPIPTSEYVLFESVPFRFVDVLSLGTWLGQTADQANSPSFHSSCRKCWERESVCVCLCAVVCASCVLSIFLSVIAIVVSVSYALCVFFFKKNNNRKTSLMWVWLTRLSLLNGQPFLKVPSHSMENLSSTCRCCCCYSLHLSLSLLVAVGEAGCFINCNYV